MFDPVNPDQSAEIARLEAEVAELRARLARLESGSGVGSRERLLAFLDNTPEAIFVKDADGRYTDVSAAFLLVTGRSIDQVLGSTDDDLFPPEIAERFKAEDAIIHRTRTPQLFEETFDYGGRSVTFLTHKFLMPTGEVAGIATDITDQRARNEAHERTEQRLRLALEGTGIAVYENNLTTGVGQWSPSGFGVLGVEPPADLIGSYQLWRDRVHPDDLERAEIEHKSARARGGPWSMEYRIVRQDNGETRWLSAYGQFTERDGANFSTGAALDITERKLAEERLAQHARILETLNEVGAAVGAELELDRIVQKVTDAGVELTGAQFGAFFYNLHSESGELLTLYTLSGAKRSDFDQFPHPRATQVFKPTFDGTEIVRSDDITQDPRYGHSAPYYGMPANHLPVRSYLAVPVKSRTGEVMGGLFFGHQEQGRFHDRHERLIEGIASQAATAMDNARLYRKAQQEIAQRTRAEQHQQLLINELNHRVKNTLAIVQSLAIQSFKNRDNLDDARASFDARLGALSAAHGLLTRANWEQASLADTLRLTVEATTGANLERVDFCGPDLLLPPQTILSIAMAVHELCTNAIKYGSLSNQDGKVRLTWQVDDEGERHLLRISWIEVDGPPVAAPKHRGFGTRLIERGLSGELGGTARLEFLAEGVTCLIEAPVQPSA
jgi:PAS domain S-box-containing protein